MNVTKRADFVSGILFIILAVLVYREGAAMPVLRRGLGPGGYPMFVAIGLGVLGLLLSIQSLAQFRERDALFSLAWPALGRVVVFMVLTLVYILAITPVGFVIASIVYLIIAIPFFGYTRHGVSVAVSVLLVLGIFLIFRYVFLVLIPTGTFFG